MSNISTSLLYARRLPPCLALALPLLIAGCGGSGGEPAVSGPTRPGASPTPVAPTPAPAPPVRPGEIAEITGNEFYFSYDESASTAGRDLSLFAIDNGRLPDAGWGRVYEFLNAETFTAFEPLQVGPFSVSMGLYAAEAGELLPAQSDAGLTYALGVDVAGPSLSLEERRNTVLTLILDVSGSMRVAYSPSTTGLDDRTLLDVAKLGLELLPSSLKAGDVINLVTFETEAHVVLENLQYSGDPREFLAAIEGISAINSTNLEAGLNLGYELALGTYDPDKINRVVMLTDALANVGATDPTIIVENVEIDGSEGIYFSGIGIGEYFDDAFLNEMTELGRGAYAAMVTPADAERLFTSQFMRLLDNAATDVTFKLTFPESLDYLEDETSAEEVSEDPADITPIHFAFNSEQFFLEFFTGDEPLLESDEFTLTVTYSGVDGEPTTDSLTLTAAELLGMGAETIQSAVMVSTLAKLVSAQTDCEATQALTLWTAPVATDVFETYRAAAERLCQLRANAAPN